MSSQELPLEEAGPEVKFTTHDCETALWNKYTERGEYVVMFDVPDIVGLQQKRRCDAIACGMWGTSGRYIHGFEIKASRSDWLREVKDVSKADPFIERCDRWWLVTAGIGIAKPEEIPDCWGWQNLTKSGLRMMRPAKALRADTHDNSLARLWAFALIRKAFERGSPDSKEYQALRRRDEQENARKVEERVASAIARMQSTDAAARLQAQIDKFEKDSGMKLEDWRLGNVGKLARKLNSISGFDNFAASMRRQVEACERIKKALNEAIEATQHPALEADDDE